MQVHERELFHQFYGPFRETVVVILEDLGATFRLSFDKGPKVNVAAILNDRVTAFKFVAGTIFEIRVSVLYGRKLLFQGTQIPTPSQIREWVEPIGGEGDIGDPLEPRCGSIDCADDCACPDPSKPVMICDGGIPKCTEV
jgi:hypothetical protein